MTTTDQAIEQGRFQELLEPAQVTPLGLNVQQPIGKVLETAHLLIGLELERPTEEAISLVEPANLETGLYVPDHKRDYQVPSGYKGVIFPPNEYKVLPRFTPALINQAKTNTQASRFSSDKKDEDKLAEVRSALHQLEHYEPNVSKLHQGVEAELTALRSLYRVLNGNPNLRRYNGVNFIIMIGVARMAFDRTLRVAGTTQGWSKTQMEAAEGALTYQLYGGVDGGLDGYNSNDRMAAWKRYALLSGRYTASKLKAVEASQRRLLDDIAKQKAFVDEQDA